MSYEARYLGAVDRHLDRIGPDDVERADFIRGQIHCVEYRREKFFATDGASEPDGFDWVDFVLILGGLHNRLPN